MTPARSARRRRRQRGGQLTALLDVLFILLFAALVQAQELVDQAQSSPTAVTAESGHNVDSGVLSAAGIADAGPVDAGADDAGADDAGGDAGGEEELLSTHQGRARVAEQLLAGGVRGRDVIALTVDHAGALVALETWRDGVVIGRRLLRYPLLREVPASESDMEFVYRGDARAEHRLCAIVLREHEPARVDLEGVVVIVTVVAPLSELKLALREGLMSDAGRCFQDSGGIAIVLDPSSLSGPLATPLPGNWAPVLEALPAREAPAGAEPVYQPLEWE